jgi:hypothetical protein
LEITDLKVLTKNWYKEQRADEFKHLDFLETKIIELLKENAYGFTHSVNETLLIRLETDRNIIQNSQEDRWRLKSRVLWIQSGDKNTRFFHQFANQRRISKHLWEIKDELGHLHTGQVAISREGEKHFKSFYNQFETAPITKQVKVDGLFNSWLTEEEAKELFLSPPGK